MGIEIVLNKPDFLGIGPLSDQRLAEERVLLHRALGVNLSQAGHPSAMS
jgi:hypothetical protein